MTMTMMEAMESRHSVRAYTDEPLSQEAVSQLNDMIKKINTAAGLHLQLVTEEPKAFSSALARYGKFSGVKNYIALIGPKGNDLAEKCGYYGEMLVLKAQQLGLNTCWVALTFRKIPEAFVIEKGEKLVMVIAIGYGKTQGSGHKGKKVSELFQAKGPVPQWFTDGVYAASLAPTAMNQQKFVFTYDNGEVSAEALRGVHAKTDLGIVKYHFEAGSSKPGLFGL